jgi:CheY-like chemotaxis protein
VSEHSLTEQCHLQRERGIGSEWTSEVATKRIVLVVDDEDQVRALLQTAVQVLGYEADVAATGQEALRCLARRDHDVVLCDLLMPDLTGDEVFRICREEHPEVARRFVFISRCDIHERWPTRAARMATAAARKAYPQATSPPPALPQQALFTRGDTVGPRAGRRHLRRWLGVRALARSQSEHRLGGPRRNGLKARQAAAMGR